MDDILFYFAIVDAVANNIRMEQLLRTLSVLPWIVHIQCIRIQSIPLAGWLN